MFGAESAGAETASKTGPLSKLGIAALVVLGAIIVAAIWAQDSYRVSEARLHDAYILYRADRPLTYAQLDTYADQVADAANVSQFRGRLIVEAFLQRHVTPDRWIEIARMSPHYAASEGDRIEEQGIAANP